MDNQIAKIKEFEIKEIDTSKLQKIHDAIRGGIEDGPAINDLMIEIDELFYEGDLEEFFYPWELSLDEKGFLNKIPVKGGGTLLEFIEGKK